MDRRVRLPLDRRACGRFRDGKRQHEPRGQYCYTAGLDKPLDQGVLQDGKLLRRGGSTACAGDHGDDPRNCNSAYFHSCGRNGNHAGHDNGHAHGRRYLRLGMRGGRADRLLTDKGAV